MSYSIEKREKGYLLFTIARNEKRNAINYEVMEGLEEAIERASKPDVKGLVITGAGEQAFCSGGDLSVFHLLRTKEEAFPMLEKMTNILYSLLTLPIPTVAILNGTAIGGGCELAISCDFRLARKGIVAGFVQGRQAITTGWGGGSILAEKFPGPSQLKLLMDAEVKPVETLKEMGIIDWVYETSPLQACEEFLEKLLRHDLQALKAYKNIWIRKWQASKLRERMEEEVTTCAQLWEGEAHLGHVQAFLSKKTMHNG